MKYCFIHNDAFEFTVIQNHFQVCKIDADVFEKALRGELFQNWAESFEAMNCSRIDKKTIPAFIDHLESIFQGNQKILY